MTNTLHIKTDNIDAYMRDIEQYPRINREKEIELYNIMHGPDPVAAANARETLITSNLRLPVRIAHDLKRYAPFADLVSEGNIGLTMAADKFDPARGRFSLCAGFWIKHQQRKYILAHSRSVRVPATQAQMAARIAKTKHAFEAINGRAPTTEEISEAVGISTYRVKSTEEADIKICSIDEQIDADSPTTFADQLSEVIDDADDSPEDMPDVMRDIHILMGRMSDKDRFLLDRSYGLTCEAVPVEVLAQETGMSVRCINGRLSSIYRHLHEVLKDKQYDF